MSVRKAFKFRVYPSAEQIARLDAWDGALRFLWNLANEQRLMGLARHCVYRVEPPKHEAEEEHNENADGDDVEDEKPRRARHATGAVDERIFVDVMAQQRELTQLRAELPWLADVPVAVCQRLIADLDLAWQKCFKGLARRPRWKRKGRSALSFCQPDSKKWRVDSTALRFQKLGNIPIVLHRPLEGTPKSCRLVRDVDQWFAVILCEVEVADPPSHAGPPVGIDRGVANAFADSTGRLVENPRFLASQARRIARAQRAADRKKKGSKNQKKANIRVAKLHRKVRRQRDHFLHVESARYSKSHAVIVIEQLNVQGMTKSAKGTKKKPGNRVAQKRGLNRSIVDVAWSRFATFLRYKSAWAGGEVREVAAAYSSQTCSACGHCAKENRPSQAVFRCLKCGHSEHADANAARVIFSRGTHGGAGCGGSAEVRRPKRQQLRVVRRGPRSARIG